MLHSPADVDASSLVRQFKVCCRASDSKCFLPSLESFRGLQSLSPFRLIACMLPRSCIIAELKAYARTFCKEYSMLVTIAVTLSRFTTGWRFIMETCPVDIKSFCATAQFCTAVPTCFGATHLKTGRFDCTERFLHITRHAFAMPAGAHLV